MLGRLTAPVERVVARQLGHPQGRVGGLVGAVLNRGNRGLITAAVDTLELTSGATAVDVGFGGGVGLDLLLDRVGAEGRVHGVEISDEMLALASRRHRGDIGGGRLALHHAAMVDLPLPDSSVAGLITINTIYFVTDLRAAATELARVLAEEGRVVVGIRDPQQMRRMRVTRHGFQVRPVDDVIGSLAGGGLELLEHLRVGAGIGAAHLLVAGRRDEGVSAK